MNLGALVERRAFRQLLAARLTGQFADGLLQAGLVGVVLFAPERAASPTRIAVGFAVLLLPFTLLAPLAGVLLDRWSRVAVLRWANVFRAILIAITATATATAVSEMLIFGPALLALALNRLILAALGASLPRTVPPELLVTGNAVAPTVGTFVTVIGGGVGLALRGVLDTSGDAAPFLAASVGYLLAALTTTAFSKMQLGPAPRSFDQTPLRQAWADVRTGAVHISHTGPARRALQVTTAQRILFGALTVWTIVMIRFLLEGTRSNEGHALAALGSVALAAGIGLVTASVIAPTMVRRFGPQATAVCALSCAGVGCLAPVISLRLGSMLVSWLVAGAGAQVLKITVDTMLQRSSPDDLRGRVFIAYDLVFNLSFVLGVTVIAALSLSMLDGALLPTALAVGYGMAALVTRASSADHWAS
ncbi:MAG: MFS transporter [Actinomycetes bacterium]